MKQLLTIKLFKVGNWELNEMLGSGGFLRQKKLIGYLKWVINFYMSEVKQKEETMAKEQSQNEGEGFRIDEIGRGKGIEKLVIRCVSTKLIIPTKFCGIFLEHWSGQSKENIVVSFHHNTSCTIVYPMRKYKSTQFYLSTCRTLKRNGWQNCNE